jgi:DNA-binding MarR family transcriptional regulator
MDSYTRIPNAVFDIAPRLTEAELRVLLFLYRRIEGWHKTSDEVSLSQLQAGTGLVGRHHVTAAVRALEDYRLIRATRNGTKPTRFQLVTLGDQQIRPLVTLSDQPLVTQGNQPPVGQLVTLSDPQKKPKKEDGGIDPGPVWEKAKAWLATEVSRTNYSLWIEGTALVALTPTRATVEAPHAQGADWLQTRWLPLLERALEREIGQAPRVVITARPAPLGRTADGP